MSVNPASESNSVRPLDDTDRAIVAALARDGRIPNADLAAAVGIAPSTAHGRVRALVERGVISGFHASLDQRALGRGLQAIIGVTLRGGSREDSITSFAEAIRDLPQVIQLFFVGGTDDFLVHIAVAESTDVRDFVVHHVSAQPSVAATRTSIIFDYHRNLVAAPFA